MSENLTLKPYVTEKTSDQINSNKFTFLSSKSINKIEVLKYLSKKYEINIKKVNVLKRMSKKVRRGKNTGTTRGFLKVIITLKDEKNIEKLKELF